MTIAAVIIGSFAGAIFVGSFFEWALHRYWMHGVLLKGYPYETHDRVHHVIFDAGPAYHLQGEEHRHLVTMAWWNGPVIVAANAVLPVTLSLLTGNWWITAGAIPAYVLYYSTYEYLHYCMHVPGPRWFQRTWVFRWIDRHHRIHHLDPMKNLNVVLPIADFLMRTRMASAPVPEGSQA